MVKGGWGRLALLCVLLACDAPAPPHKPLPPPPPRAPAPPPDPLRVQTTVTVPKKVPKPTKRFLEVSGHVEMNHRVVIAPVEIPDGALISTGPDGLAVLTLMPGNALVLRSNSTLDVLHAPRQDVTINLHIGALWGVLPKDAPPLAVVTPTAKATVRATEFAVHTDKAKGTDLCACQGQVWMQTPDGKISRNVVATADHGHQAFHFARRGRRVVVTRRVKPVHSSDGEDNLWRWATATLAP